MLWSTIDFSKLTKLLLPSFLRKEKSMAFYKAIVTPLQAIQAETLYKMQHNGTKIYFEKMLNESYAVAGYNHQNHEATKLIYIDDVAGADQLYIWQDLELESSFLQDDDAETENDVFLNGDSDSDSVLGYSWIIYMPDTISFTEYALRALVDSYRYIGKKYTIEIYTP